MNCFRPNNKTRAPSSSFELKKQDVDFTENRNSKIKHEVLLKIPGCKVHLMEGGEAIELANGDFTLARISDENVSIATTVSVGHEHGNEEELLQWPLTKDEPVVKLDSLHYLFSLPMKDGDPLSYGVTFLDPNLGDLDSFLKTHALLTVSNSTKKKNIQWKEFAPRIDDYNNVLAKAIAGGTGQIVKGIFKCSNAYTNQVKKTTKTCYCNRKLWSRFKLFFQSSVTIIENGCQDPNFFSVNYFISC